MTRPELEQALRQQQAENAALRAELARARPAPVAHHALPHPAPPAQLVPDPYPAVLLTDAAGRVTWVSEGFTHLCGFALREVVGQPAEHFLRPTLDDPATLAYVRASLRGQQPFQYEAHNRRPNGQAYWVRVRVQPVRNEQHEVRMLVGLLEDITAWKNAQSTLAESERRFQALAENAPGVLYEWRKNFDGTFAFGYVSPRLFELFGIPVADIGRMPDFVHPDDVPAFRQSMAQAVQAQAAWTYEGRLVVAGQPLRWMQGNSVVTGVDAAGIKYSGILQDVTTLKRAQRVLREQDLRWRLAVEGFGDGIWVMDLRTRQISFSVEYKAMLGYRDDEPFPHDYDTWQALVHPDDLAETLRLAAACVQGHVALAATEHRMRCKDGTYKWVLNRALVTERGAAGEPLVFSGAHTDISELKKTKTALDSSAQRLSTVIANFQEGLVLEDENREIVLANEAFCRLLHVPVTPAELVGRAGGWLAEGSKSYLKTPNQYVARITALLRRQKPVTGDILRLRDGRVLQRDFTPIFDQQRYIGHLWKYADITARAQAEADLKQREEKYRGIIENMSLGLVEADLNDHLLYANQSFCDLTGFCDADLAGRQLSPLLLSGDDLALVQRKLETRQRGIADSYEVAITTKSGEAKWLLVSGAPLYNERQEPIGSIGIYLDVTPQKRLEASLREAKGLAEISTRAKQEFLANMSHEIRTPMNAILGMSQLLAKTALDAPQARYLHAITASAENLLVIINDILDLSKIEAGLLAVEKIGFSPVRVCTQVEQTIRCNAEEKGLDLVLDLDPQLPAVLLGDPYRITQILLNLVGNSVKFTERGEVRVGCALVGRPSATEAVVEFTVQDTGVGIDAAYLARVFDDFSQEDSSVTRKYGGTGLGLGISKKLVALLGGELRIESEKHRGTTSRFCLPLPVGAAHDVPQKDGADFGGLQHALRGRRVLLVEDNLFNRMLATIFLADAELDVTEAANGQVAVELARQHAFDLILMDVQMPVMNGYEATACLRQQLRLTTPVIALTANATTGEREKCLAAGMNGYLTKPFQEATLLKTVYDWVLGPLAMGSEQ